MRNLLFFIVLFFSFFNVFYSREIDVSFESGMYINFSSLTITPIPLLMRDIGIYYLYDDNWSFLFKQRVFSTLLWSNVNRHSLFIEKKLLKNFRLIAGLSLSGDGSVPLQFSPDLGLNYQLFFSKTHWLEFEWINYFFSDSLISELETTLVLNNFLKLSHFAFLIQTQTHTGVYNYTDFAPGMGIRLGVQYRCGK